MSWPRLDRRRVRRPRRGNGRSCELKAGPFSGRPAARAAVQQLGARSAGDDPLGDVGQVVRGRPRRRSERPAVPPSRRRSGAPPAGRAGSVARRGFPPGLPPVPRRDRPPVPRHSSRPASGGGRVRRPFRRRPGRAALGRPARGRPWFPSTTSLRSWTGESPTPSTRGTRGSRPIGGRGRPGAERGSSRPARGSPPGWANRRPAPSTHTSGSPHDSYSASLRRRTSVV